MKLYKLTDENAMTRNNTQWGPGVTHNGTGEGDLCGPGWIHAYTDPLLAVLFNPIHADFKNPRLWEAEGDVGKTDHGFKVGCRSLTTIREISVPEITTEQRVRFAILCARQVCDDPTWMRWVDRWLSGEDRSEAAAATRAAVWTVGTATRAATAEVDIDFIVIAREAIL